MLLGIFWHGTKTWKELSQQNREEKNGVLTALMFPMSLLLLLARAIPLAFSQYFRSPSFPNEGMSLISGCWLTHSRLQRKVLEMEWLLLRKQALFALFQGALELGSAFSGEPLLPVEHGEKYSWQPMLLGRWMIVFCSCCRVLGDPGFTSRYN